MCFPSPHTTPFYWRLQHLPLILKLPQSNWTSPTNSKQHHFVGFRPRLPIFLVQHWPNHLPKTLSFHHPTSSATSARIQINTPESYKFLGLIFHHKLSWTPQIKILKAQCLNAINILKYLSHSAIANSFFNYIRALSVLNWTLVPQSIQ